MIICINNDPGLTLTYIMQKSKLVALTLRWGEVKIITFSESMAAFDLKVGICIVLPDLMILH